MGETQLVIFGENKREKGTKRNGRSIEFGGGYRNRRQGEEK